MSDKQKYKSLFMKSLSIEPEKFNENLKYNEIDEWDSIGHMTLISELEDCRCCCVIPVAIIKY